MLRTGLSKSICATIKVDQLARFRPNRIGADIQAIKGDDFLTYTGFRFRIKLWLKK